MSIIPYLASQLQRRDEKPNIELVQQLVNEQNQSGIQEVIANLSNPDKNIQNDCIKVAYEIGKLQPEWLRDDTLLFIELLKSRNNRLVWGAMQVLSTLAFVSPTIMMEHVNVIMRAIKVGTVITMDKGILTLAKLASLNKENNERIFPFLLEHIKTCRSKDIPQHAESTLLAVNKENREEFLQVLQSREREYTPARMKRIQKIYQILE